MVCVVLRLRLLSVRFAHGDVNSFRSPTSPFVLKAGLRRASVVGAHTAGLDRQTDAASGACSLLPAPIARDPTRVQRTHPATTRTCAPRASMCATCHGLHHTDRTLACTATGSRPPCETHTRRQAETAYLSGNITHLYTRALHATQGHHLGDSTRARPISDGRQQLAVKAAETVEELPLDWVRVDLQRFALQGQHEDALAL